MPLIIKVAYLHVSSPDISFLAGSNFSNFDHGVLLAHQLVTGDENQLSGLGPIADTVVEHFPGLDKFGTRREQMSIENIVVRNECGSERGLWEGGRYGLNGFLGHDGRRGGGLRFYDWFGILSDAGFNGGGLWGDCDVESRVRSRIEPLSEVSLKV